MNGAVVAATTIALIAATGQTANASAAGITTETPRTADTINLAIDSTSANIVDALDPYVQASPEGWTLTAPENVLAAISGDGVVQIQKHIAEGNQLIRSGELVMGPDGVADLVNKPTSGAGEVQPYVIIRGDHGSLRSHWYGWELRVDKYGFEKISSMIKVSASLDVLATAIAVLVGAIATEGAAVIVAAVAVMVATWDLCKQSNGGATIYIETITKPPAAACNPF